MSETIKRMDLREFLEIGLLQEVNRAFFHPRGLALEVVVEDNGTIRFGGVWDYRDDPEGMGFGPDILNTAAAHSKAALVLGMMESKRGIREALYGHVIQPLGGQAADSVPVVLSDLKELESRAERAEAALSIRMGK